MAVHLNARLKTRFIPFLFTMAALTSAFVAIARAERVDLSALSGAPEFHGFDAPMRLDADLMDELRTVMSESVDPARIDRKPGLSPIVYAPRPGERPTVGTPSRASE